MGVAGDMLVGALLDLLDDDAKQQAINDIQALSLDKVTISVTKGKKQAVAGTKFDVNIEDNHNHHHHHHTSISEIMETIDGFNIDDKTKQDAKAIYKLIAKAESKVHGEEVSEIHLHEVGMKDAIIDITSACYLINKLDVELIASPITTGYGEVKTAHGIMSVPAPATAILLSGIPMKSGDIEGELCTPTGIAILKYYAKEFSNSNNMTIAKIGIGLGTKDFEKPNCVRVFLSEDSWIEKVVELRCQVDDMTGEEMGYAIEKLISVGAKDAYVRPIVMKKSRPAMELTVITTSGECDEIARQVFKHTTTIGIRKIECSRYAMDREIEELGAIHIKRSSLGNISKEKLEFDDIAKLANEKDISIFEAKKLF